MKMALILSINILLVTLPSEAEEKHLKLIETFDQLQLEEKPLESRYRFKSSSCDNYTAKARSKGIPDGNYVVRCRFYARHRGQFIYTTPDREFASYLTGSAASGVELKCQPIAIEEGSYSQLVLCKPNP